MHKYNGMSSIKVKYRHLTFSHKNFTFVIHTFLTMLLKEINDSYTVTGSQSLAVQTL
jgi:hypothetical protein